MRRFLILASLVVAALIATAPAEAGSRVGFSHQFVSGPYYYAPYHDPYYYASYHDPYYRYRRHYPYHPPRTVVVERPVYVSPPAYVTPPIGQVIREGRDSAGNYCREYQSTTSIDGRPVPTYGTACLRPDGSWQIIN